jgi:hypothetical protein
MARGRELWSARPRADPRRRLRIGREAVLIDLDGQIITTATTIACVIPLGISAP